MTRPPPSLVAGDLPREPLEGELARFFSYSHDVLAIMDAGGRVLVINPSVERVLGYPIEEIIGRRFLHWVHLEDRPEVRSRARALRAGNPVSALDIRVSRTDGGWVPMRWSLSVGHQRRIYAVGRDRTDQVQRRQALLREEMSELRLRTAMELHDGVLQTLTGAGLQIAVARRLIHSDPAAAGEVLEALGNSLAAEQREMRLYVDEVKGSAAASPDGTLGLRERIETLIERVGAIWGVSTSVDARVTDGIPPELGRQILRIIQEATVNAVRHGAARTVAVSAVLDGPEIAITVSDDGTGFSFLGEYDSEALREKRLGPLSLKHRVEAAGGGMSINSTPGGSTVTVRLPLSSGDGG